MTPERWQRIEQLYHAALECPPEQRTSYLAEACTGDQNLKREVETLLERDSSSPDNFLNHRAFPSGDSSSPNVSTFAPGARLGPYEIQSPLGAGGMGEVYKARDTRLDREVALKVLPAYAMRNTERRLRFIQEAKSASRLNHPHVVTIYDIGEWEGKVYIAMEYVAGKTLGETIPRSGLAVAQILSYAIPIADALAKAHTTGIVHRDLKPGNIMVTPQGIVKLLDFGLAKLIETPAPAGETNGISETPTRSMAVMGTPSFMSPEQAQGKTVDARTDIFSFGAVLYEMASGRRAFRGDSTLATISNLVRDEPEPLPVEIPRDLQKIIQRCLRKDPERRWQSAADIRVALEEFRDESSTGQIDAPNTAPARPPRARQRMLIAAGILATAGLLGGAAWVVKQPAERPVWTGSLLGGSIIASHPRISPDGQLLAFRAIVDGQSQVAVMKPEAASWTVLTHDLKHGAVACVAWAWDGSKIYFDREWGSGGIYAIAPLGGEPRLLLENARVPEPLPDGSLIVLRPSADGRQQLLHFWPDSGRLEPLPATVVNSDTRTVRAFPDGKEIAVLGFYGDSPRRLFALNLSSGKARDLAAPSDFAGISQSAGDHSWHPETIAVSADGLSVFTQRYQDDTELLLALPRDGSGQGQIWLSFPFGATPLSYDAAPDGSIYMDHSAFDSSVLNIEKGGKVVEETHVPSGAFGLVPLPDSGFVFSLTRGGRSQLMAAKPGSEPHPLLNTNENAKLPGAWLGSGKLVFVIGEGDRARLAIASVEDGRVLQRFQADAQHITAVSASPDGRTVYYASEGIVWAQAVGGANPEKLGAGFDVTADPAGKNLYLMRAGADGYKFMQMPAGGGEARKIDLPAGYNLTPNRLSPAAVNRDGRILMTVNTQNEFFYRIAILDPVHHTMAVVPVPPLTVAVNGGWAADGSIRVQVTHWTSTLWHYRPVSPGRKTK
jgi:serine/threonine protein kinase